MSRSRPAARWLLGLGLALLCASVSARPGADQVAALGGAKLTCTGAERAASKNGVAAYAGKWLDTWPGLTDPAAYTPGPYADEKPVLVITAENSGQYADRLSDGQKAMFAKLGKDFRMPVYPSHRDFRFPDQACAQTRENTATAALAKKGLALEGMKGGVPFPFPEDGLQGIWNVLATRHVFNETATLDSASVFPNGTISWGKAKYLTYSPYGDPKGPAENERNVAAYFRADALLPLRNKGDIAVGYQPLDFSTGSTRVWTYNPGTRRMRQAPDIAFDYPVPPAGLHTVDDDHLFNGSPERFNWKLVGKRELFIPYNNFRINDPALKYTQLLTPKSFNPEFMRYELHRVWVIEGTLKPGLRHVYGRRVIFADEDTWLAHWSDSYDTRGQLWRTGMVNYHYAPNAQSFHRGVTIFHDLNSEAYEAGYLVNEAGKDWWRLNRSDLNSQMFTPEAATRGGH